jgi:peptidoglycan pentaglycine glycine transferase (the first glycine)
MLIRFGNWCWDMFGASSNNKRNLKPTYLLQYRCIQWARERSCTYFDFRTIPEILEPGEEMWGVMAGTLASPWEDGATRNKIN